MYSRHTLGFVVRVIAAAILLSAASCSKMVDDEDTKALLAVYASLDAQLSDEIHVTSAFLSDHYISYNTLTGYGRMRTITRNKRGGKPIETLYYDTSSVDDSLSYMRCVTEDVWTLHYFARGHGGKRVVLAETGRDRMRLSWSASDEVRFERGDMITVRMQRWFPDGQYDDSALPPREVRSTFRDIFNISQGKLRAAQPIYDHHLGFLREVNFEADGPWLDMRQYEDEYYRELGIEKGDPNTLRNQRAAFNNKGNRLFAEGDLEGALLEFQAGLKIAVQLAAADPSNAGWQRDLVVSYWRMADIAEKTGQGDAGAWWRKAYDQLAGMKQRGIMQPTDEQYLSVLREKADGSRSPDD